MATLEAAVPKCQRMDTRWRGEDAGRHGTGHPHGVGPWAHRDGCILFKGDGLMWIQDGKETPAPRAAEG
jgi:hypothetical protein